MNNYGAKRFLQKIGVVGAGAAVFGLVAGGTFAGVTRLTSNQNETQNVLQATAVQEEKAEEDGTTLLTTVTQDTALSATDGSVASVAAEVMPSIVAITAVSETEYRTIFGQSTGQTYQSESAGSGIIVAEKDGYLYIATNNHVVTGANALTVQFADDTTAPAEIQGTDSKNDLAVVKVAISDLDEGTIDNIRVATLGDSDQIQVGETAIAIGNALGYGQSVTTGIISATNREVSSQDATTGEAVTAKLLQTDAAINPGNSGGALLNASGAVIGINSAKYSDTSVEGMGFAIPINTAKEIVEAIINGNLEELEAQAGYLGVSGIDISEEDAAKYNMPQGVYIAQVVKGSAADQAGLRQGQIITKIDDTEITSASELSQVITSYKGGDTITITVATADNGSYVESTVTATLGSQADKKDASAQETKEADPYGQQGNDSQYGRGQYGQEQYGYGEAPDQNQEQYGYSQPDQGQTYDDLEDFIEQFMR